MNANLTATFPREFILPRRAEADRPKWLPYALVVLHLPLGALLATSSLASTVHAVVTLAIGLYCVLQSRRRPELVAYLGAYIVGAEVLWRMTGAVIPWEFGKYATSAIFIAAMLFRGGTKIPRLPVLFFALLLPSVVLTIVGGTSTLDVRNHLSFYMSGPLTLMVSSCFFRNLKVNLQQLQRLFLTLVFPTLSIAAVTLFGTLTATRLTFTSESNFTTSGGFGPNQVSGALGLGALMALLYLLNSRSKSWLSLVVFAAMVLLSVQSALTFSRGGLYNAVGGAALACLVQARSRRVRSRFVIIAVLVLTLGYFLVVPALDTFTGGAFSVRFSDVGVAHRDDLIRSDLVEWGEHPILGLGPGMLAEHRAMPHTEFTRLLAEHGVFGLAAILTLLLAAAQLLVKRQTLSSRGLRAGMIGWSLLFMLDKAMRVAAPATIFGLAFISLTDENPDNPRPSRKRKRVPSARIGGEAYRVLPRRARVLRLRPARGSSPS